MEHLKNHVKLLKELDAIVRELDESVRPEAFKFLLLNASRPGAALSTPSLVATKSEAPAIGSRQIAPQELIRHCGVSNLTDKALVLAFWLELHQNRPTFTSTELKEAFSKAREPAPTNPSDVVGRLEAAGKVMKSESSGRTQGYKLTSTGIAEVEKWSIGTRTEPAEKQ